LQAGGGGRGGGAARWSGAGCGASGAARPAWVAEDRLDALTGTPGVIDAVAGSVTLHGSKVKGVARRAMTAALAIRFILLMTLMPPADPS
jgi:hypothetical protein